MKRCVTLCLTTLLLLIGCADSAFKARAIYRIQVIPAVDMGTGEDAAEVAEAANAMAFYAELSSSQPVFMCSTWNHSLIDGKPRYEYNSYPDAPVELDPYGHCIEVDENYFAYDPVKTVEGGGVEDSLVYADDTLNVLVPGAYREREDEIMPAYLERFWFDKVEVDNTYRERLGQELNMASADDLRINIIYVEDGQGYFTFDSRVAAKAGNMITDPLVMVYTGNIHTVQAFGRMAQGMFIHRNSENMEEITEIVKGLATSYGVEDIVRSIQAIAA